VLKLEMFFHLVPTSDVEYNKEQVWGNDGMMTFRERKKTATLFTTNPT
jgi:hypothetical protein